MSFIKKLIPKHTILGKSLAGDTKGALSSAKNYVKSGELFQDFKNISTGNVGAIVSKGIGSSTNSLLNKKPTESQINENLSGGTSYASSEGQSKSVYNVVNSTPITATDNSNSPEDKPNTLLFFGVGILAYFLIIKK